MKKNKSETVWDKLRAEVAQPDAWWRDRRKKLEFTYTPEQQAEIIEWWERKVYGTNRTQVGCEVQTERRAARPSAGYLTAIFDEAVQVAEAGSQEQSATAEAEG